MMCDRKDMSLIVHVGDIVVTGNDIGEIYNLKSDKSQLAKEFDIKDLKQL